MDLVQWRLGDEENRLLDDGRGCRDAGGAPIEAGIRYLRPLWFDDEFDVACSLSDLGRASFTFTYELTRGGEMAATGFTRHACVDRASMRPVRVPE